MTIFGWKITKDRKDAPPVEAKTLTWEKLWGAAREWVLWKGKVTRPYAQVPSVYKAVKAICDNVPQAQMGLYDWETDEEIQTSNNTLLQLLAQPRVSGKRQSGNDFMQELVGYYALNNEAFIRKVSGMGNIAGTRGLPAELWVLNPAEMHEVVDRSTGMVTSWKYRNMMLTADEVIHIKDFNPYNENRGLNPTEPLGNEMNLDYLASIFNMAFFQNDATPNALLMSEKTLNEEQRKRLREWMEKRHQGAENKHKLDVLEGGLKLETITPSHKDMEFTEQRKFSREELLGAFRTPKALFNITEDLNYATFQGQMKVFWLYAIMPILRKIEDAINVNLVWPTQKGVYFAFNIKNVPAFQEDFAEKVTTAKTLFDMGFTANEINQKLGLGFDDKDWRDFWWIGFNLMPADQIIAGEGPAQNPNQDEDDDDDTKGAKPEEAPKMDILGWHTWKAFVARQAPAERLMDKKLSRFFFEQRGRLLGALNDQNKRQGPDVLNWESEDAILKKYTRPIMEQAVNEGVKHAQELTGTKSADNLSVRITAYIEARMAKIVGINSTTRKLLRRTIDQQIEEGASIQQIADAVKDRYNLMTSRAKLISRTETAGAVNGGSNIYYEDVGIPKKKWLTAGDELVRESHRRCEAEGAIKVDGAFVNGCRYPGDQEVEDAGEVVNCRCTLIPILEK